MTRKDYPFSNRDLKRSSKLISGLFVAPFALLDALGSSNLNIDEELIDHEYRPFKTTKFLITNIITGIVFLVLGCTLLIFDDWWTFFAVFLLWCLEAVLIIVVTPILGIKEDLSTYYNFNKYDFSKQVTAIRFILVFWSIVFVVHIIIDTVSIIHWHDSFFASFFILFDLTAKLILTIYFLVIQINFKKYLSENESVISILKGTKRVNITTLCELYDRENDDELHFTSGDVLKAIKNLDIMNCGFTLIDKNGHIESYLFHTYVTSQTELIITGKNVLEKISKEINKQIVKNGIN